MPRGSGGNLVPAGTTTVSKCGDCGNRAVGGGGGTSLSPPAGCGLTTTHLYEGISLITMYLTSTFRVFDLALVPSHSVQRNFKFGF